MNKYPEEDHARALHAQLNRELASKLPGTKAVLSGEGVHWNCRVERKQRSCTIHCFDASWRGPGPEFLVYFEEKPTPAWTGRTWHQAEAIAATCAWFEGRSIQSLYAEFAFVERKRRALERIKQETVASEPRLAELTIPKIVPFEWGDGCTLWFHAGERSSKVDGYTYEDIAHVEFYWDECLQFSIQTGDTVLLARLLGRWLCDNAMPSVIQSEFPSVALRSIAAYYEQGRGLEGEFIESWDHVEDFYKRIQHPFASQVLNFIQQLRSAGYERTLRAGTSLFSLLVSRSQRYGLRLDQPYIGFSFGGAWFNTRVLAEGEMEVAVCFDVHERVSTFSGIELNADLNTLLKQLEEKAID